jgi:hypothetical protein
MNRSRSSPPQPAPDGQTATRSGLDATVTSQIDVRWHAVLERMLFFNDQQHAVRARVAAAIEQYGSLKIEEDGGFLRLRLERLPDAQALYCVLPDGRPIGCIVYSRDAADRFLVLHVAVEPAYSARGGMADGGDILLKMVGAVRAAARRTRGVERVDLLYAAGRMRSLRIRAALGDSPG